mmetsp:Transcript_26358/g.77948  ORF Transcript_26358/g.77948 Transcript_26358/m.77948 type:complete len:93 (+) Transcript_26358:1544-1822(+)
MQQAFVEATGKMADAMAKKAAPESKVPVPAFDGKEKSKFPEYWEKLRLLRASDEFKGIEHATETTPENANLSLKLFLLVSAKLTLGAAKKYQ